MIFMIPQLIEHVSSIMTIEEGDLLLTGTPKGVGPVKSGDEIRAGMTIPGQLGPVTELLLQVRDRQGGFHFKL